jgi:hypothetical protein
MRKLFRALIISLLVIALVATTIYALTTFFTVPWDMTVVIPSVKSVAVFSDAQGTQPVVAHHWGNVSPGQSLTFDFYLKNTGTGAVTVGMIIPEDMTNILTGVTFTPATLSLNAGQIGKTTFTATVSADATAGLKQGTYQGHGE